MRAGADAGCPPPGRPVAARVPAGQAQVPAQPRQGPPGAGAPRPHRLPSGCPLCAPRPRPAAAPSPCSSPGPPPQTSPHDRPAGPGDRPPQRPPVRPLPSCPSPSGQLTSPQPGDRDFPPQPARISPFLSAAAPKTDPRPPAGAGLARDPSALLSCRNAPYPDLLPALSPARQAPCLPEKRVPRCGAPSRSASPGACPRARSTSRLVCQSHFG